MTSFINIPQVCFPLNLNIKTMYGSYFVKPAVLSLPAAWGQPVRTGRKGEASLLQTILGGRISLPPFDKNVSPRIEVRAIDRIQFERRW